VFGFSIALLIVSVEVPTDFSGFLDMMKGFAGFALSFAMLILIWMYHYCFIRDYKLEDNTTIVLNSVLLFVVCAARLGVTLTMGRSDCRCHLFSDWTVTVYQRSTIYPKTRDAGLQ
jgi:uncharacterized membrane protein